MRNRRRRIVSRTDSEEKSSRKSLVFFPSHIPHYAQMLFKKAKDARSPTPQTNPINAATQRKLPHFGDPTKREKRQTCNIIQHHKMFSRIQRGRSKPSGFANAAAAVAHCHHIILARASESPKFIVGMPVLLPLPKSCQVESEIRLS